MCLILFAWKMHENFPLVLAANRDEFYERPSAAAAFWEDAPDLLAGRDLREGGTWLGITRAGRFAALTNYRDPESLKIGAPSRGGLTSNYLRGRDIPEAYLNRIRHDADRFNGFSLLVGDPAGLFYFSNRGALQRLKPGIYGLSNRLLDTPWPKVERGKTALLALLKQKKDLLPEALFALLTNRTRPPDDRLPDTGVGLTWERILSPLFIESPVYGTRSSTVLLIDRRGSVTFAERVFNGAADPQTVRFTFCVKGKSGD
ncbi:MAG: NRDE family protein [Deltaproteobacteria bacterium]|nr:NRDE family protein [Deltaproteobacteria bacterium]